jgi:centrosomal CEP192-like protein/low-density lipoprotein receptor class B
MNRFVGVLLATAVLLVAVPAGQAGSPPALAFTPSSYHYGTVTVGQTASQTFTLRNNGGTGTGALSVALTGSSAFTKTADTCSATSLGPRKSCSVTVTYTPSTAGSDSATLSASSKKPAASASVVLSGQGAAARHVYWTTFNVPKGIGRADISGQNATQTFIVTTGNPLDVEVDASHVYWSNVDAAAIGRADLSGQNANENFISTGASFGSEIVGVAVDSAHIYWADFNDMTIGRADLNGQNVEPSFIAVTGGRPEGVAVDGGHVYWTNLDADAIGRADLNGLNVDQSFIMGAAGDSPWGVTVDSSYIYWANQGRNTIGRADLNGLSVDQSFITPRADAAPTGIAVDAAHVYFTEEGLDSIGRADLDGQNVNDTFVTGMTRPFGVTVDAG